MFDEVQAWVTHCCGCAMTSLHGTINRCTVYCCCHVYIVCFCYTNNRDTNFSFNDYVTDGQLRFVCHNYILILPLSHSLQSRFLPVETVYLSFTLQLHFLLYRLSTDGRRSFPVAVSIFCHTLPDDVQSAPSVCSLWRQLKTFLFHQSFPDVIV